MAAGSTIARLGLAAVLSSAAAGVFLVVSFLLCAMLARSGLAQE